MTLKKADLGALFLFFRGKTQNRASTGVGPEGCVGFSSRAKWARRSNRHIEMSDEYHPIAARKG